MSNRDGRDAVITGIGLMSPIAEGADAHFRLLTANRPPEPLLDTESFAPYPVHPAVEVDLSQQIPKRGDQRQMEPWQRIGTYTAGLALDDAGIAGNEDILGETGLIVAAGGGERDPEVDATILEGIAEAEDLGTFINEHLMSDLRPTLFLAQLSNLLAGNISIVHRVTGSSRSFMGEELCGSMAIQTAMRQIQADQGDVFLVGGSYNAIRPDMLLVFALGDYLLQGKTVPPLWAREGKTAGMVTGSMGAFLVMESRDHAERRGARIYARVDDVMAERGARDDAQAVAERVAGQRERLQSLAQAGGLALMSGASGAPDALAFERQMLDAVTVNQAVPVRGCATMIGHGIEAQTPACVALAALALHNKAFYPPFDATGFEQDTTAPVSVVGVTGWGHWRGEALVIVGADG